MTAHSKEPAMTPDELAKVADSRPIAEPTMYSFRSLDQCKDIYEFAAHMLEEWGHEPKWSRVTLVSPDMPMPPYADGWYFEGWAERPERMTPPHQQGSFNYPSRPSGRGLDKGE
jgi:hypothetical protein